MTKQTIKVEGLPEGFRLCDITIPKHMTEQMNEKTLGSTFSVVITIEKIQPRRIRIVLEETGEDNQKNAVKNIWCTQFFSHNLVVVGQPKIWREVKETDIPLTTDEPKLSLSVDQCKKWIDGSYGDRWCLFIDMDKFIKENS